MLNEGEGISSYTFDILKYSLIIERAKKDLPEPIDPFKSKISPISKISENLFAIRATSSIL